MLPVEYVLPSGPATLTAGLVGASLNTIFTSVGALVTVDPCVGVVDTTVTCADAVGTHTPRAAVTVVLSIVTTSEGDDEPAEPAPAQSRPNQRIVAHEVQMIFDKKQRAWRGIVQSTRHGVCDRRWINYSDWIHPKAIAATRDYCRSE